MKISIYIATSANGLISNSRNVPDWLSPDYGKGMIAICQKVKAVIMGKTTYDIIANNLPLKNEGTTVVMTRHKQPKPSNPTVIFTDDNVTEIVQMLAAKGHTEAVIIGGAITMSTFIKAGLVNDIYFVVEPILFGSGLSLLKEVEGDFKLNLLEITKLNDNTVQIHYELQKQS